MDLLQPGITFSVSRPYRLINNVIEIKSAPPGVHSANINIKNLILNKCKYNIFIAMI